MSISLVGKPKSIVLAALYNASRPQGMGFLGYDSAPMTCDEAEALLKESSYFDYLRGRVLKVDLGGDTFDPRLYDRDNGQGAAERAIGAAFAKGSVNPPEVAESHRLGTEESAAEARGIMGQPTTVERDGDLAVTRLGLADVDGPLSEAMRKTGH